MSAEVDRLALLEAALKAAEDMDAQADAIRAETLAKIMAQETASASPWWLFQRRPVTLEEAKNIRQNSYRWWDHSSTYRDRARALRAIAENARCSELKAIRIEQGVINDLRPFLGYEADV